MGATEGPVTTDASAANSRQAYCVDQEDNEPAADLVSPSILDLLPGAAPPPTASHGPHARPSPDHIVGADDRRERTTASARGWSDRLVADTVARHLDVHGVGASRRVLVSCDDKSGTRTTLASLGLTLESLERDAMSRPPSANGAGAPQAGAGVCVLDGSLERASDPAGLLADVYARLEPDGLLVATVADLRRQGPAEVARALRRPSIRSAFPGETLASLLFQEGFERPRFRRSDDGRLVATAHRSALAPPRARTQVLSVVMPVYNERETFREVMDHVLKKSIPGVELEIVVVESNSTDGTREEVIAYADDPRVRIVLQDRPCGKGNAVRAGLERATGDFLIIQDADLEYDVDDYDALLEPLRRFERGFVLGVRGRTDGANWGVRHFERAILASRAMNVGNVVFLTLFNLVYGQHLRDPFTMYKVVRRDCLHGLTLECDRFDFDWELTAKLIRSGYTPAEVPVQYHSRSFSEGKKISVLRDPITWIVACFKYRFKSLEQ